LAAVGLLLAALTTALAAVAVSPDLIADSVAAFAGAAAHRNRDRIRNTQHDVQ
jgi:hypothetical protein